MNKSSRILIIPSWYPPDGGYFFKEHSESLYLKGWSVDVLVTRMVGIRKLLKAGLSALHRFRWQDENGLRVFRSVFLKIPGNQRINVRRRTAHIFRKFKIYEKTNGRPDLILAHSVTWAGYAASLIHEAYDIPYVIVEHRSFFVWKTENARKMVKPFYIPYFEKAYRHCERLILVSESLLNGLQVLFPWIKEKTEVIPNMIREDMFLLPASRPEPDPFVFFWAGRLEHVKGLDVLLESVLNLINRNINGFSVRLAGRGSLKRKLMNRIRDMNLNDRVHLLGRLSREEIQSEMAAAHCFVLPSRYEAFGIVLIEAMATGLPVIAARSGGPEHIITGECGLLVDAENPCQLADAMEQMMNRYSNYSREQIRSRTLERYGQTAIMNRYDELLHRLLRK